MKKLLFLFMAVLACNYVIAQQKVYCEIVGTQKFAKSQVTVGIDFGQEDAMRTNALGGVASRNKLVGDDGKPLSFNSMVDAMNWIARLGIRAGLCCYYARNGWRSKRLSLAIEQIYRRKRIRNEWL